eukprot:c17310_g1_i1.p1 GENE.c17310_g1_i1~~c17310_g1_i1.p1  ORF type:complete len:376 (+),score=65.87 c17310_g1_i1:28-1128(+)
MDLRVLTAITSLTIDKSAPKPRPKQPSNASLSIRSLSKASKFSRNEITELQRRFNNAANQPGFLTKLEFVHLTCGTWTVTYVACRLFQIFAEQTQQRLGCSDLIDFTAYVDCLSLINLYSSIDDSAALFFQLLDFNNRGFLVSSDISTLLVFLTATTPYALNLAQASVITTRTFRIANLAPNQNMTLATFTKYFFRRSNRLMSMGLETWSMSTSPNNDTSSKQPQGTESPPELKRQVSLLSKRLSDVKVTPRRGVGPGGVNLKVPDSAQVDEILIASPILPFHSTRPSQALQNRAKQMQARSQSAKIAPPPQRRSIFSLRELFTKSNSTPPSHTPARPHQVRNLHHTIQGETESDFEKAELRVIWA